MGDVIPGSSTGDNLMHHILPPTEEADIAKIKALKEADVDLYNRLDAVVLQWIYATVSSALLHAILVKNDTAAAAWSRLEQIFMDNKGSRATHLEEELADVRLDNFSSAEAYCNHVKSLADRLADVGIEVSESRLVLRLLSGLTEAYSGTVDYVQNQDPLPSFESVRSRIKLAERTLKHRAHKEAGGSALLASSGGHNSGDTSDSVIPSSSSGRYNNTNTKNKKKNNNRGGPNRKGNTTYGQPPGAPPHQWQPRQPTPQWQPYGWPWQQWAPPCPFPTAPW